MYCDSMYFVKCLLFTYIFCLEHKLLNDNQSVNYCYTLFFKHFERNHVHIVCIFLLKELLDLSSFEDDLSKTSSLIRESYTS